ncbi:hypothetical protein Syun_009840 [Stephania yunnanensis]|uniref:Uncharacterized protein n=1 Tax=Stephania yunnanensis TaxID=152371 RepID=A0AAP0KFA6_9MAGN
MGSDAKGMRRYLAERMMEYWSDGGVVVDDGTMAMPWGGHGGLRDGVHRRGDAGDGEVDVACELRGEGDGLGREVDVVWEEDDIIIVGAELSTRRPGKEKIGDYP